MMMPWMLNHVPWMLGQKLSQMLSQPGQNPSQMSWMLGQVLRQMLSQMHQSRQDRCTRSQDRCIRSQARCTKG
ncbi:hypothetical protein Lalb_Chr24g0394811 [Lupinus albus]|uniref:Uncharacterized protein n=1 Tax=Lupinus albus TaxID=3870 RepID=A0A6A4N7H1_LUPAL|nr:hypothetical protein Lalb_Chr24g0394811 [Lupinus albus]